MISEHEGETYGLLEQLALTGSLGSRDAVMLSLNIPGISGSARRFAEQADNDELVAALETLVAAGDDAQAATAGGGEVVLDARPILAAYDGVVEVCEAGGFSISWA